MTSFYTGGPGVTANQSELIRRAEVAADEAEGYRDAALNAATTAIVAQDGVLADADRASAAASNAEASASAAALDRSNAESAASNSLNSATAASTSEGNAASSASEASGYAISASQDASATAADLVETAQDVVDASSAAADAEQARDQAQTILDQINLAGPTPVGTVISYLGTTAPTGYLVMDGAEYSRTTYTNLFSHLDAVGLAGAGDGSTTFTLPDFRGEFPRFTDDGRGVDVGRTVGSAQGQTIQSHRHTVDPPSVNTSTDGAHNHTYTDVSVGGDDQNVAGGSYWSRLTSTKDTSTDGAHSHTVDIPSFNSEYTGDTETRPRNVSLLPCIKF